MEYTLWNVILLNIPLVLAEYVCCMILTRGLTKCRPQGKAAVLLAKCRLSEAYNGFLEQETSFRGWKAVIILLRTLKFCVWKRLRNG